MSATTDRIYVLHVDDEPDFADMAAQFLNRHDDRFDVETVTSASDAFNKLAENEYDCVVSDFDMPGQDGIEFLQDVREDYPDLPFILYTGKGSEAVASEAISAGVTDYLQKETGTSQYEVLANRILNAVSQFQTRRELDRSQDLLQHTEQLADVGGWEADVQTGQQRWTKGTYEIHDIDPDSDFDPTVDAGMGFYHPDDQDEIERLIERCMERGEPYDIELRLITAKDQLRWVRSTGEPVRKDGDIVTIRGAIRDITERKEREHELLKSKERYETLMEGAPDPVFVADAETGEILEVNSAAVTMIGESRDQIVGGNQTMLHPEEDAELYREAFEEHQGEGETIVTLPDGTRPQLVNAEGETMPVEISEALVSLPDGAVSYHIFRDISENVERTRELAEKTRELETIVQNTSEAIYIKDTEGYYQFINESGAELFDLSPEEVIGKQDGDLFEEESAADIRAEDTQIMESGQSVRKETARLIDEEKHVFLDAKYPYRDEDGEVIGLIGISPDITKRKEHERDLWRQNERLDEFASVVSHDLRNPLNVAKGRIELAKEEYDTENLDAAAEGIERSLELIDDMLSLARGGQEVSEMEPVDVAKLVDTCWETVDTGNATVVTEMDSTLRADRSRLHQLLENLFRNAVEHGAEDVTVRVESLPGGFYVEDDGPGIPETDREDVLEAGYSTREGGTGFGLNIVTEIVEAHDWEIRVTESTEGGARFEITDVEFTAE